jgi:ATP-binding cassette, subfamily G (WHITE), member 2, SNQ2
VKQHLFPSPDPLLLTVPYQNIGITIAFGIGFLAAYLIITEFRSKLAETRSVVAFKRGTKELPTSAPNVEDVETAAVTAANSVNDLRGDDAKTEKALATAERMTNTFSWEGLNYTVPVGDGEERRLLNKISGYVVPGKLTALMGESGAGKVRLPSSLGTHQPELTMQT